MSSLIISGKNSDVKAFLKDLPVKPGEKVSDFIDTFHDNKGLLEVVKCLYSIDVAITSEPSN